MQKANVVRQIVFPGNLYELIQVRLDQLGISTPEYVRQLVVEDVKPLYRTVSILDIDTEESLREATKEVKLGKVKSFKTKGDIKKYLGSLAK